jgi:hypothetical protein
MDSDRFDSLTRALTVARSRRTLLGTALASMLAALGLADAATKKKGKGKNNKGKNNNGKDNKGKGKDKKKELTETCVKDADCKSNVCADRPDLGGKLCAFCRDESDCARNDPQGFRCLNNACVDCSRDADCPRPGQGAEQRLCVEPLGGGCPAGQPCACRQCFRTADCPQGATCDETGTCTGAGCTSNQDCASGVACVSGACTGTCRPPGPCADCANNPNVSCCNSLCGGVTCCDFGQVCNQQTKTCS